MRLYVYATRQPRDDHVSRPGDGARDLLGEGEPRRRGVARADDGDLGATQAGKVAPCGDQGRGRVDLAQERRIIRLVEPDQDRAAAADQLQLLLGLFDGRDADRPARLAAGDEGGKGLQRRTGPAMAGDERVKAARANVFAAQEAQPVETLSLGERAGGQRRGGSRHDWPIRVSLPAASRVMLGPCLAHKIAAMIAKTIAVGV